MRDQRTSSVAGVQTEGPLTGAVNMMGINRNGLQGMSGNSEFRAQGEYDLGSGLNHDPSEESRCEKCM